MVTKELQASNIDSAILLAQLLECPFCDYSKGCTGGMLLNTDITAMATNRQDCRIARVLALAK